MYSPPRPPLQALSGGEALGVGSATDGESWARAVTKDGVVFWAVSSGAIESIGDDAGQLSFGGAAPSLKASLGSVPSIARVGTPRLRLPSKNNFHWVI